MPRPGLWPRVQAAQMSTALERPVFFDMVHSNNAARVRLWLRLKGMTSEIESRVITYPDLQTPEFAAVNPLKKVFAFRDRIVDAPAVLICWRAVSSASGCLGM